MVELKKDYPKLRSCPFCGGKAVLYGEFAIWIYCNKCGCERPVRYNKDEAIEAWNKRIKDED